MIAVVGSASDRRVAGFAAAAAADGHEVTVVPYEAVLDGAELPAAGPIRIDGSDGDAACEVRLRGGDPARSSASEVPPFAPWFAGFRRLLDQLAEDVEEDRFLAPPAEVVSLFDKRQTSARLGASSLPVTPMAPEAPSCGDEVFAIAREHGWPRVFVKPRYGSGGARIAAVSLSHRDAVLVTPSEFDGNRIHYSKRQRPIRGLSAVREALDRICGGDDVVVERWYPRATAGGRPFDLRVLTIAGEPSHCVLRSTVAGVTNLNLGGRRGDLDEIRSLLGSTFDDILATCRRVGTEAFPRCFHLGIDVLVSSNRRHHVIGEVNAFGDLLVGTTHHGLTSFEAEVAALPRWLAQRTPSAA